ncbi:LacI family DNA-binding transcriptional regulator [Halalkalibacterium halodurans]|jgi:LacI family transcriptional regulator|uniref:LacI family transcriptional regulator n=1 Tax=Halalkalibacterium halodurans TaxID=86665 RepID=A0A0M0KKL9_ALKHA|nr:LacI family DNA-binding transcriptional regulator [Halalkalibacterium halodurans]MED4164003.1 LacI family DNA-binding transcriptional regulator [Halalkalibacterium halodurans]TES53291.1 LacI family transcriptional regulator [Halalkalibacterium halodurans]TPE71024.1 LacI family transcriptional regulator [Halalkalibacterium halodurans]
MATIYDIAKKTGYSITTVSKVLNNYTDVSDKARKKVMDAVTEMGYFPSSSARMLTTKKSWTIGVVFVEKAGVGMEHPFFSSVIENFKKNVERFGYDLLFASNQIGNEAKTYLEHFRYRGVDGIVVVCSLLNDPEVEKLMKADIPSVVIDLDSKGSSAVYSDNEYGSELAVDYLVSLGHRSIAHISGDQGLFVGVQRLKGFKDAIQKLNLSISDEFIVDGGFFTYEGGQRAMEALLRNRVRPTAVYAAGDLMALGAIDTIRKHGLSVPEDFSIVGFDDIQMIRYTAPALTTIRQNTDLIGKTAANLLLDQINENEKQSLSVKIPVTLIERDSCRKI